MFMVVFPDCLGTMGMQYKGRPKGGVRYPGTGVIT